MKRETQHKVGTAYKKNKISNRKMWTIGDKIVLAYFPALSYSFLTDNTNKSLFSTSTRWLKRVGLHRRSDIEKL